MTDQSIRLGILREGSAPVVALSSIATVVVAILSTALPHAGATTGSDDEKIWGVVWVAGWALGGTILTSIPAAIAYRRRSRQRDPAAEIVRLENGELSRPVGLIVVLAAAGITVLTTIVFGVVGALGTIPLFAAIASGNQNPNMAVSLVPFFIGFFLVSPGITTLIVNRAFRRIGHYLGPHPYRATAISVAASVGGIFLLTLLIELSSVGGRSDVGTTILGLSLLLIFFGGFLLLGAQSGTRFAQHRQAAFIDAKLSAEVAPDPAMRRLDAGQPRPRPLRRAIPGPLTVPIPPDPAQRRLN